MGAFLLENYTRRFALFLTAFLVVFFAAFFTVFFAFFFAAIKFILFLGVTALYLLDT